MHLVVERTDIDGTPSEAKMTHGDEELPYPPPGQINTAAPVFIPIFGKYT